MGKTQPKPDSAVIDVYEAAGRLRVSDKVIRRLVAKGILPKLDTRRILIPKAFFERWIDAGAPSEMAE